MSGEGHSQEGGGRGFETDFGTKTDAERDRLKAVLEMDEAERVQLLTDTEVVLGQRYAVHIDRVIDGKGGDGIVVHGSFVDAVAAWVYVMTRLMPEVALLRGHIYSIVTAFQEV